MCVAERCSCELSRLAAHGQARPLCILTIIIRSCLTIACTFGLRPVQANLKYSKVLHDIKPLTDELAELEASLQSGAQRLQQCEQELAVLDERKGHLQNNLTQRTEEAAELKVSCFGLHSAR